MTSPSIRRQVDMFVKDNKYELETYLDTNYNNDDTEADPIYVCNKSCIMARFYEQNIEVILEPMGLKNILKN